MSGKSFSSHNSAGPSSLYFPGGRDSSDGGRGHWQRSFGGTPRSASSTCAPHPTQLGFPHRLHVTLWHIFDAPPGSPAP